MTGEEGVRTLASIKHARTLANIQYACTQGILKGIPCCTLASIKHARTLSGSVSQSACVIIILIENGIMLIMLPKHVL